MCGGGEGEKLLHVLLPWKKGVLPKAGCSGRPGWQICGLVAELGSAELPLEPPITKLTSSSFGRKACN